MKSPAKFLVYLKLKDILLINLQIKAETTMEIYWTIMKTLCIKTGGMQQKWKFSHFLSSREIFSFKSA